MAFLVGLRVVLEGLLGTNFSRKIVYALALDVNCSRKIVYALALGVNCSIKIVYALALDANCSRKIGGRYSLGAKSCLCRDDEHLGVPFPGLDFEVMADLGL